MYISWYKVCVLCRNLKSLTLDSLYKNHERMEQCLHLANSNARQTSLAIVVLVHDKRDQWLRKFNLLRSSHLAHLIKFWQVNLYICILHI